MRAAAAAVVMPDAGGDTLTSSSATAGCLQSITWIAWLVVSRLPLVTYNGYAIAHFVMSEKTLSANSKRFTEATYRYTMSFRKLLPKRIGDASSKLLDV